MCACRRGCACVRVRACVIVRACVLVRARVRVRACVLGCALQSFAYISYNYILSYWAHDIQLYLIILGT